MKTIQKTAIAIALTAAALGAVSLSAFAAPVSHPFSHATHSSSHRSAPYLLMVRGTVTATTDDSITLTPVHGKNQTPTSDTVNVTSDTVITSKGEKSSSSLATSQIQSGAQVIILLVPTTDTTLTARRVFVIVPRTSH